MLAIVTDTHYRMSLALIRDLAEAGVEVIACERAGTGPALGALSKACSHYVELPDEGYLDALYALCRQVGEERRCRPALLPVGAATLGALSQDRARFDAVAGLCIGTPEQLDLLNSKQRLAALAAELGVPVPASFSREKEETPAAFAARLPLPCVVKPICGEKLSLGAAQRYQIAHTPDQAQAAFTHFAALAGEDPVVQTYLPGGGLGCSVLAQEGTVLAAICHRREREYPITGGPSTCCTCIDAPQLVDYAARIVKEISFTGLAMFEFKEDAQGAPHLLEVNPRIWGTFPLTRISGSGIPLLWATLAWNAGNPAAQQPLPPCRPKSGTRMIFAASDAMAALGYLRRGQPKKTLAALADLFNPAVRDGLFQWSDPKPGLAYLRSVIGGRS